MAQNEFEKESRDAMVRKMASLCESFLLNTGETFCIQGEPLKAEEVASHNGCLSLFCFKAAEHCEEVMHKPLPIYYEHDPDALLNVVPMTEASEDNAFALWSHFLLYSVEEEVRRFKKQKKLVNGQVPLDELYQEWHQSVQNGRYAIRPSSKPSSDSTR